MKKQRRETKQPKKEVRKFGADPYKVAFEKICHPKSTAPHEAVI